MELVLRSAPGLVASSGGEAAAASPKPTCSLFRFFGAVAVVVDGDVGIQLRRDWVRRSAREISSSGSKSDWSVTEVMDGVREEDPCGFKEDEWSADCDCP